MHDFIADLEGGHGDEEILENTRQQLSKIKIGIHKEVYNAMESFLREKLIPVVYETEETYPIANEFYDEEKKGICVESNEDA